MSYAPYTGPTGDQNGQIEEPPKRTPSRLLIIVLLVVGFLIASAVFFASRPNVINDPLVGGQQGLPTVAVPLPVPKVGSPAPDFELVDLNTGQPVTLSSLKGQPVWINFWATWCPPCKEEMPIMEKRYQENKDKGLVILGVDVQEKESDVSSYIKQGGYSWTFLIDKTGKIADSYHVNGLPSHYFIDKDGLIQAIVIGGLKSEMTGEIRDVAPYLQKIMP